LAIEGNRLSPDQVTAILDGKRVLASPREVQEVRNALLAYERFTGWMPQREQDLLEAHRTLMAALVDAPGRYRAGGVGVMAGDLLVHMAPPAHRVPGLMADLLAWLGRAEDHPLITSSVFHYELEFIHPFADGNGRIGRLWQTLILSRWRALFADLPVETLVHAHQDAYYQAIAESTEAASATPFHPVHADDDPRRAGRTRQGDSRQGWRCVARCDRRSSDQAPIESQAEPQTEQVARIQKGQRISTASLAKPKVSRPK
jgi:Fic family protein